MGGGGTSSTTTQIYQPTPPAAPSTAEGIQAYVDSLPALYQAQLNYAPKEAAQQVDLAQQYALPLAQAYQSAQDVLYPGTSALQEQLASAASSGMNQGAPDAVRQQYLDNYKANLGTNAGSFIGAQGTAQGLAQLDQSFKQYYNDLALSVAGRQPLSQPQQSQYTNQLGSYTPGQALGYQSSIYNSLVQGSRPITTQNNYTKNNADYSGYAQAFSNLF